MPDKLSTHHLEAAATWFVDLQGIKPNNPLHQHHQQWLQQDPLNKKAWARVEKLRHTLSDTPSSMSHTNLIKANSSRRHAIKALSVLLITGTSGVIWQQQDALPDLLAQYRTGTGENLSITLNDGSQLDINTRSAVDIHYTDTLREIRLYRGEIQLTSAKDPLHRPLIVSTPQGKIQALGTQFLVQTDEALSHVTVIQHAVNVRPNTADNLVKRIEAGQKISFSSVNIGTTERLIPNVNAWTQGLLIVSNWRLADFIDELSRYHTGRLTYADSVADLHISGAFNLQNIPDILDNLSATLAIDVRYFSPYWIRVSNKNKG
ncbi:MAG: iron dicitrate transport regulator FecR [Gammaproteobacteria bacterium]|nr:MAG: iron dicitrate transport regulator FecR [Gammaproteobacteria bacterium]